MVVALVAVVAVAVIPLGAAARSVPGDAAGSAGVRASTAPSQAALAAAVPSVGAGSAGSTGSDSAPATAALPTIPDSTLRAWPYESLGYRVVGGVPFTTLVDCGGHQCQLGLDIYVPGGSGPFATVVLVGPSGRGYLSGLAEDLASRGIMVYNADWRDVGNAGGGYPAGFEDVACAVRFARASASQYGGAGPVTLIGHSLGGWVGSVVALDQVEFQGGCLVGGSGRPDAFVGLAGNYSIGSGENSGDLANFFGGTPTSMAASYAAANPFNYATGTKVPVQLVAGTDDDSVDPGQSQALDAFLVKQGWNVTLTLVPGGSHTSIFSEQSTREAIFSAIAAAYSVRDAIDPLMWSQSQ